MNRKRVFQSGKYHFAFMVILTYLCLYCDPLIYAQLEMKVSGSHFQNFNTLAMTGSDNAWVDNQTIPGWYWQCGYPSAPTTYFSDDGTSNYVGKRCYGTTGDSDRAIGGLCNSSYGPYTYGMKLYNASSKNITSLSVGYTGEQWKVGQDKNQQLIKFYYKITTDPAATFTTSPNVGWTAVTSLNFLSPKTAPSVLEVLNGNAPENRTVFSEYLISGITIPPGSYILLRWHDAIDNNDHGLAIDDVTVKWVVPSDSSDPNIWNGAQSNDWFDSRNWSKAVVPDMNSDVEIASVTNGAVCNEDIKIKNLKIRDGGTLTMEPGKTITVTENSSLEGQNCLILRSPLTLLPNSPNDHAASASFLNHGTVSGNGSIKIERYIIQYFTETDGWHFFSSPVDNANIDSQFLPGVCDDLYIYKEISDEWLSPKTTPDLTYFVNGLGYLISYINNSVHTISGVPNNNDLKFNNLSFTGDRGWHLLGNPYPCGLKWGGTDWGINGISLVAKLLNSGGTYTDLLAGETIPAMNGFFVKANSTSNTITIPKSARLHSIADGWKRTESSLDKKMKLMIQSNTDNTFAETRIIVNQDATTGYDISKDSPYLSGMPGTPLFYQVTSDGRELSTNCIPDSASLKLNFEFTPGLANEYTLKAVISDEWAKTSNFVFEDKLSNVKYPILNGTTFKFKSNSGDIKDRFRLAIDIITGITKKENIEDLNISCADRHVKISMPHQIDSGRAYIFDLVGKQVFSGEFVNGKLDFKLPNSGFYLLHVLVKNGTLTRKILAL